MGLSTEKELIKITRKTRHNWTRQDKTKPPLPDKTRLWGQSVCADIPVFGVIHREGTDTRLPGEQDTTGQDKTKPPLPDKTRLWGRSVCADIPVLGVIEREGTDTDHPENKTQLDKTRQDKTRSQLPN